VTPLPSHRNIHSYYDEINTHAASLLAIRGAGVDADGSAELPREPRRRAASIAALTWPVRYLEPLHAYHIGTGCACGMAPQADHGGQLWRSTAYASFARRSAVVVYGFGISTLVPFFTLAGKFVVVATVIVPVLRPLLTTGA
jgi:hypothetical protein